MRIKGKNIRKTILDLFNVEFLLIYNNLYIPVAS